MARTAAIALLLVAVVGLAVDARSLEFSTGRSLLYTTTYIGPIYGSFSLSAFGPGQDGYCYIQGYPGSRADSAVAGPLNIKVPTGRSLTISFSRGSNTYYSAYNITGSTEVTSVYSTSSDGLVSTTFAPNNVYQNSVVTAGLIPVNVPAEQPTCLVVIQFQAVVPPPSPSPPPPPSNGGCTGAVPCYCQNGYCFNNGATLTNTCKIPSGSTCYPASVNPASIGVQYATGYGSSVNVCKCF